MCSSYSDNDLKDLQVLQTKEIGTFTIDEWIEYNKNEELNSDGKLETKMDILTKYPRVKFIKVYMTEYLKNSKEGIRKIEYEIIQHIPKVKEIPKEQKSQQKVNKSNNERNIDWRKPSRGRREYKKNSKGRATKFKIFNVSQNSRDKVNSIM